MMMTRFDLAYFERLVIEPLPPMKVVVFRVQMTGRSWTAFD
tara:strand:+ start:407 stop:529 length:123 start_codon:yes stop_codon:yes gene_type:complete